MRCLHCLEKEEWDWIRWYRSLTKAKQKEFSYLLLQLMEMSR